VYVCMCVCIFVLECVADKQLSCAGLFPGYRYGLFCVCVHVCVCVCVCVCTYVCVCALENVCVLHARGCHVLLPGYLCSLLCVHV